jgi:phosphoglycerate dehydrogenase-like enzyme
MHTLLLLAKSRDQVEYITRLKAANLPDLQIVHTPSQQVDLVFGEPNLIRDVLHLLPNLVWVQATWAGVDPLLDPSLRRDYLLTNARGIFGGLMSEFVFGYLLLNERKILQRLEAQKRSEWDPSLTGTLKGKTIGLLGVGSIGAHIAGTARHFGMHVRGYTRSSEGCTQVEQYFHGSDLLIFATGLDVLVSVLPNTAETRQIINAALLSRLPKHTIFINVGRGSAVDEPALLEALAQDNLACAVLDVFSQEPLPHDHPFWRSKNLYITSHTAAPSLPKDIANLFIENYLLYNKGDNLKYLVNFELGY